MIEDLEHSEKLKIDIVKNSKCKPFDILDFEF